MIVLIVMLAATICSFGQSNVPATVSGNFDKLFPGASEMRWKNTNDIIGVSFSYRGAHAIAYFSVAGELIAKGRLITEEQLPMTIQDKLQVVKADREKKAGALSVEDVYEFSRGAESVYVFTLQNDQTNMQLVADGGRITLHKKIDKKGGSPGALLAQLNK